MQCVKYIYLVDKYRKKQMQIDGLQKMIPIIHLHMLRRNFSCHSADSTSNSLHQHVEAHCAFAHFLQVQLWWGIRPSSTFDTGITSPNYGWNGLLETQRKKKLLCSYLERTWKFPPSSQIVSPAPSLFSPLLISKLDIFIEPFVAFSQLLLCELRIVMVFKCFCEVHRCIISATRITGITVGVKRI